MNVLAIDKKQLQLLLSIARIFLEISLSFDLILQTSTNIATDSRSSPPTKRARKNSSHKDLEEFATENCFNKFLTWKFYLNGTPSRILQNFKNRFFCSYILISF